MTSPQSQKVHISYKPHIDGIRGIAVLFVVLYHFFPSLFIGGFIGVDIFFVISGFLISMIILKSLEHQTFSFTNFYARRIKRIFPALLIMCSLCLIYGWFVLFEDEFMKMSRHATYSSFFLTNLSLYKEGGYFDAAADYKPLLHLWSLAVEEQFYLVWPFILWVMHTCYRRFKPSFSQHAMFFTFMFVVTLGSLSLHFYYYHHNPRLAFYFTAARLWELSIGATGAYVLLYCPHVISRVRFGGWAALLSLIVIILSLFVIDSTHQYFQYLIILPVIASLILLLSTEVYKEHALVKCVLTQPVLIFLGLISYPLYLLHWPLISFIKIISPKALTNSMVVLLLLLLTISAYGIYRYVEGPIRRSQSAFVVRSLIVAMLVMFTFGFLSYKSFITSRAGFNDQSHQAVVAGKDWDYPTKSMTRFVFMGEDFYRIGQKTDEMLFIGDSNIQQYAPRVESKMKSYHGPMSIIFATFDGAFPMLHLGQSDRKETFVNHALAYAYQPQVKTIILGGQWHGAFNKVMSADGKERVLAEITRHIKQWRSLNKNVYVVSPMPVGHQFDPKMFSQRSFIGIKPTSIQHASEDNHKISHHLNDIYKRIVSVSGNRPIDIYKDLCHQKRCLTHFRGRDFVYKDGYHLRASFVKDNIQAFDFLFNS